MSTNGYNILAITLVLAATLLAVVSLIQGLDTVDIVAITSPLLGLSGTIAGRGDSEVASEDNDSSESL